MDGVHCDLRRRAFLTGDLLKRRDQLLVQELLVLLLGVPHADDAPSPVCWSSDMDRASLGKLTLGHYAGADLLIDALISPRDLFDHNDCHRRLLLSRLLELRYRPQYLACWITAFLRDADEE